MVVEVKQGKLEGLIKKSEVTGQEYYAFLGIPYAKPPVGELRFQPPQLVKPWNGVFEAKSDSDKDCIQMGELKLPKEIINSEPPKAAEPWNGVFEAKSDSKICAQMDELKVPKEIVGSEDCLYLNVYTTNPLPKGEKQAVMVWIHGGGFSNGSGKCDFYNPEFLLQHDIVFVSINYRLHVLGFLNLNIPSCRGNMGLKDQQMALKWIKENIAQFGGDAENITLFGESAGASSVQHHMISPTSKGLFEKAIAQSGSSLVPWSYTPDPEPYAFDIGRHLGYSGTDKEELVTFLSAQDASDIIKAVCQMHDDIKVQKLGKCSSLCFVPSPDQGEDAVLPGDLMDLIKSAPKIPLITGKTDKEGFLLFFLAQASDLLQTLGEKFPKLLKSNFDLNDSEIDELTAQVKKYYFGDGDISAANIEPAIDLYTHMYFLRFYESYEHLVKSKSPVYFYEFEYLGKRNVLRFLFEKILPFPIDHIKGAAHGDELGYLFKMPDLFGDNPLKLNENDKKVIDNVCTMWTNFAKTGNPSLPEQDWKPSVDDEYCFLRIGQELSLDSGLPMDDKLAFWKPWIHKLKSYT